MAAVLGKDAASTVADKLACENTKDEDFLFILEGRFEQVALSMLPSQKQLIKQSLAAKEDAMLSQADGMISYDKFVFSDISRVGRAT